MSNKKVLQTTLDMLYLGEANVRKELGPIDGLIESIKEQGIINPLTVRKDKTGKYEIIAGRRRFESAKALNLKEIPIIVKDVDDIEAKVISLRENWDRGNLTIKEEGQAFRDLLEKLGSIPKVADYVKRTREYVRGALDGLEYEERTGVPVKQTLTYTPKEIGEITKDVALRVRRVMRSRDVESKLREKPTGERGKIETELGLTLQSTPEKIRPKVISKFRKDPLRPIEQIVEEAKKEPEPLTLTVYFGTDVSPFILIECDKVGLSPTKWVQTTIRNHLINAGYKIAS